jgi:hypothetical protein
MRPLGFAGGLSPPALNCKFIAFPQTAAPERLQSLESAMPTSVIDLRPAVRYLARASILQPDLSTQDDHLGRLCELSTD